MKTTALNLFASAGLILSAGAGLVPNGDFQLYKPETDYAVTATFADGGSFARGVGNGIELAGGSVNYSDGTTGNKVDLPGWLPLQSGNDLVGNGVGGSTGMNLFAAWGGDGRIQSAASLGTVKAGGVYTISVMVGGPDTGPIQGPLAFHLLADGVQLTPTASVNPTLPNNDAFQKISRTYQGASIADHIGKSLTIVLGVEDANDFGNRVIFDDVSIEGIGAEPSNFQVTITPTAGNPGNYSFQWDSKAGKLYDLVSSTDLSTGTSSWTVWDGRKDLSATPPLNTLANVPGSSDPRRFFAVIEKPAPPPAPLLSENFESGTPPGWVFSNNGAGTSWSVGTPSGVGTEPDAAANGTRCVGTNMGGNYTPSAMASMITPAFTVPASGARLKFSQYIDTEAASGGGDFGSIRLLNAADNTPLAGGDVSPSIQGIVEIWTNRTLPLPAAANGQQVKLEFRFESAADAEVFSGFYIDDVLVEVVLP